MTARLCPGLTRVSANDVTSSSRHTLIHSLPRTSIPLFGRMHVSRTERINASSTEQQQTSSYRVSLFDAMKVFGPAPERINCRLAMLMFIPMAMREMETAETILDQFAKPDYGLVALCLVTIYASMIPIVKGAKDEDFGFMKVRTEKINGRLAMLGWAALLWLEHYAGDVCFF